jgi:hypothetical protein
MFSDAPIDLKIKSHMICDLLNLISIPSQNPFIDSNNSSTQINKQVSYSTRNTFR